MKIFLTPFILISCLCLVGCGEDDVDCEPFVYDMAQHAQIMGYKGNVKQLQVYCPEDDYVYLTANFDAQGRCIHWNDTGVDHVKLAGSNGYFSGLLPNNFMRSRGISSGWMSAPASYDYFYNSKGQLIAVHQRVLGRETEHYKITYGNHGVTLPLPFPIGTLSHFPICGIATIESENFRLTCDGVSAFSERHTLAWMSLTEKTEYLFEQGRVVEKTMRLYGGKEGEELQQLERVRTFFDYSGVDLKRVLEVAVDADGYQEKLETIYSLSYPFMVERKRISVGMDALPLYEMVYRYDDNGRVVAVENTIGEPYFEMPYRQQFLNFDNKGNWTEASRYINELTTTLQQNISYW